MEGNPPDIPRCGAKLRGKDRFCQKFPLAGKTRCKLHGGATPKGIQNALKHGLYSQSLPIEQQEVFDRHLKALLANPKTALLASAALIQAHAERLVKNAPDGFLRVEKTRKFRSEAGETDDGVAVTEEREIERTEKFVEVTHPISEALYRAARIAANAHDIEKQGVEVDTLKAKLDMLKAGHDPDAQQIVVLTRGWKKEEA